MAPSGNVSRTPPGAVLTALRREVNFHCPAETDDGVCGSPYLSWHHFDPPWRVEHHHRPEGMVALCREHADKADGGAYTVEQIQRFKREGAARVKEVSGRFDWMRREVVIHAGGGFFVNFDTILQVDDEQCIGFDRNENGELTLNFRMPPRWQERTYIEQNTWHVAPNDLFEVICPPQGRMLSVRYKNGDFFRIDYREIFDAEEFVERYPTAAIFRDPVSRLNYPVTVASITSTTADGVVQLSPEKNLSTADGAIQIGQNWMSGGKIAIYLESPRRAPVHFRPSPLFDESKIREAVRKHYAERSEP